MVTNTKYSIYPGKIYLYTEDGKAMTWNDVVERHFGYSPPTHIHYLTAQFFCVVTTPDDKKCGVAGFLFWFDRFTLMTRLNRTFRDRAKFKFED